jgi:hypothetical protein
MFPTLENSNSSVGDIRDSTTKIIDITLPTRGIISKNLIYYSWTKILDQKGSLDVVYLDFFMSLAVIDGFA